MSDFTVKITPYGAITITKPLPTTLRVGLGSPSGSEGTVIGQTTISASGTTTLLPATSSYIECDATNGNQTIVLPDATLTQGKLLHIKKIDSTVNTTTIQAFGTQNIDGATTFLLDLIWDSVHLRSNGTNWRII